MQKGDCESTGQWKPHQAHKEGRRGIGVTFVRVSEGACLPSASPRPPAVTHMPSVPWAITRAPVCAWTPSPSFTCCSPSVPQGREPPWASS